MPSFSQMNIKSMAKQILIEVNKKLESFEKSNDGLIFKNFSENVSQITLSVICAVGFGGDIDDIDGLAQSFVHLVEDYFLVMMGLIMLGKWFTKLPLPHNNKFYKSKENLEKRVMKIIEKKKKTKDESGRDLLSLLINAQGDENGTLTDQELFDESVTFLFAGHDTTSSTLAYLFFQFAKNPKLQEEVYQEMVEKLKGEEPNYENTQKLQLLYFSIKETLRMSPPAVFVSRQPDKDEDVIGYAIPKDLPCFLNIVGVHYNEKYWDKPYEFNPRRWETIDEKKMKYCYFPFSVGPRDCAGRNLAMTELCMIPTILMQRYRITFPEGFNSDDVSFDSTFVLKLSNLQIQLKKRE